MDGPGEGEVQIRLEAAGICHSDWNLLTGDTRHVKPLSPGHEGSGVVEAVGKGVTRVNEGDRVILNWAASCGQCFYCGNGRPNLCGAYTDLLWSGRMLDGTTRFRLKGAAVYQFHGLSCFAERCIAPQAACINIGKGLGDGASARQGAAAAALIGCAVTTGVGAAIKTAPVPLGCSALVLGVGGVGLSIVMGAKLSGADPIIAVDVSTEKLEAAIEFGATHTLINDGDLTSQVKALTEGRGADYVFEASGLTQVQEQALRLVRPGGTVALVGLSPMGSSSNLPGAIITRKEITVCGSYYGTADERDFLRYADWYRSGRLPLDRLTRRTYGLEQINQGYEDLLAGSPGRGVIHY